MALEAGPSWDEQKQRQSENFHLDLNKLNDPVEDLLAKKGPEQAVADLEDRLDQNPNDEEARRQLTLIRTRLSDLITKISGRIDH